MPEIIRSVKGRYTSEQTIEKSRFISYCAHVTSEEEARAFIAEIQKLHSQATHNCYGYIADKTGALQRFSDDGEPQGTAGMPILDVIKNKGLYETAVVVTRYFGGIKLGAGGLVRAYASSAADVLNAAEICLWQTCSEWSFTVDYGGIDGMQKFISSHPSEILDTVYADKVTFVLLIRKAEEQAFSAAITDYFNGKIQAEKGDEYFYPFADK